MKKISNALIKDYTTYKLDGVIKEVYFPSDVLELKNILRKLKGKYKIIGMGSNLIISSNYDGALIKLENFDKLDIDETLVKVGAGYSLSKLALKCADKGLSGLEFAFGIPATIGGAVFQNAGAYGRQMDLVLEGINALDDKENIVYLSKEDLKFGYRDSILRHRRLICLEVFLRLKKGDTFSIKEKMRENMRMRKEKQPLEYPSAGSVFRNPPGNYAGKLIEEAGLKGFKVKGAMVSLKHANFIVNIGGAKGEDVIKLINIIREKVYAKTGILLECEQEIIE